MLAGKICHWILLFQEFDFEIIMKLSRLNAGPDHLPRIVIGEEPTNIEDGFPYAQLFKVGMVNDHYEQIIHFLSTWKASDDFTTNQKK